MANVETWRDRARPLISTVVGFAAGVVVNASTLPEGYLMGAVGLLFLVLAYLIQVALSDSRKIENILQNTGVVVYPPYDVERRRGDKDNRQIIEKNLKDAFEQIGRLVAGAESTIFVLNAYTEERPWSVEDPDPHRDIRNGYFQEIEARIRDNPRLTYARVIQIDPVGPKVNQVFYKTYLMHFKKMLEQSESDDKKGVYASSGPRVTLKKCAPLYPSTFMIIDDRWVVWQLYVLEEVSEEAPVAPKPKKERFRMRSILIIDDKSGNVFVPRFASMFQRASASAYGDVVDADLRPPDAPAGSDSKGEPPALSVLRR